MPAYGIVTNGTYTDAACRPATWSYGLFPNWRNVFWSCNWWPISRFQRTRWGVEHFGAPVAISNGWEDDRGPWEWTPQQRDEILRLFRERLKKQERVRYLTDEPAKLLMGAPDSN